MSDARPPEDGSSWPERDLERAEEPASGWPDDDPYRYEPPPRWEPQPFEPLDEPAPWQPPRFDDPESDEPDLVADDLADDLVDEAAPGYAPPQPEPPQPAFRPLDEPYQPYQPPAEEPAAEEPEAEAPEANAEPEATEQELVADPDQQPPPGDEQQAEEQQQAEVAAEEPGEGTAEADSPEAAAEEEPEGDLSWQDAEREAAEPEVAAAQPAMPEPIPLPEPNPDPDPGPEPPHMPEPAWAAATQPEIAAVAAEEEPPPLPPVEPEEPTVAGAEPVVAFEGADAAWDPKLHGNRRRPTTAEQAVPWLIGIILALAGMVIVLLALIFTSPSGLMAGGPTATPSASGTGEAPASVQPSPSGPIGGPVTGSAEPSATPGETPQATPTVPPTYGPLEMVYLGRQSATAPIYVLRRDFSKKREAEVLAQAGEGIEKFAWAPDGTVGLAIISDRAVALRPDKPPRRLVDDVAAATFGWDAETVYAVRITREGARDKARVLQLDFKSREATTLTTIRYPHPVVGADAPLREAQFIDDGGLVRLVAMADGHLNLWILGAPDVYQIDPADGAVARVTRQPTLWSPDGTQRIALKENGGTTRIRVKNRAGDTTSSTAVTGLVSHIRWAGTSNEIVFTLGVLSAGGGVRQDLYVWDLQDGGDPLPLTSSGTAFGAEWRGVMSNWAP
ncbi:MAG TPA: hypothetical protein VFK61_01890 [Candidatus Limnocylindria bacterium]|nr:hypothetical protein [Candidatus Limnocylindria bacterium]